MRSCHLFTVTSVVVLSMAPFAAAELGMGATASPEEVARAQAWMKTHVPDVPAFSLRLGDRDARSIPWQIVHSCTGVDDDTTRHVSTYTDPDSGFAAIYTATICAKLAAIELLLELENPGTADSPIIDALRTLDTSISEFPAGCTVHHARGDENSAESFAPMQSTVNAEAKEPLIISPTTGRSSEGAMPYFNMAGDGMGVVLAIGWAGRWQTEYSYAENAVHIQCGMHDARFLLHPGERVRLPRVLLQFWNGADPQRGTNLFRQWMLAHSLPKRDGHLVMPPISGSVTRIEANSASTPSGPTWIRSNGIPSDSPKEPAPGKWIR
jgi:alpha-galactosidase